MATIHEAAHVRQLAELNRRVADSEAMRSGLQQQYSTAKRAVLIAGIGHAYRRLQLLLRAPAKSFNLWPLGVMLVGPLIPGFLAFVLFAAGSLSLAFGVFVAVAIVAAGLLAFLIFVPD